VINKMKKWKTIVVGVVTGFIIGFCLPQLFVLLKVRTGVYVFFASLIMLIFLFQSPCCSSLNTWPIAEFKGKNGTSYNTRHWSYLALHVPGR
jgi:hypothetical protein